MEMSIDHGNKIQALFSAMIGMKGQVSVDVLIKKLHSAGIMESTDPRLKQLNSTVNEIEGKSKCYYDVQLDLTGFSKIIKINPNFLTKALTNSLIIPNFDEFEEKIKDLFDTVNLNFEGNVKNDFTGDEDDWGLAICTVDGQRCFFGHHKRSFILSDLNKPLVLGLALQMHGITKLEKYVGHHQTAHKLDETSLDFNPRTGLPTNPMTNSGSVAVCCSLFEGKNAECIPMVYQKFFSLINNLAGDEYNQMRAHAFMEAKEVNHDAYAIAHFLAALNKIPPDVNPALAYDFYCEAKTQEVNCESLSVIAATFANAGVNPLTGTKVLKRKFVKYILSVTNSSGMNRFSAKSGFLIGRPAKSSATGGLMLIIPGLMGVATYSPRVNDNDISERGLMFCEKLVDEFKFHPYDDLTGQIKKKFPAKKVTTKGCRRWCPLFAAAVRGDLATLMILTKAPDDVFLKDYCGRTLAHVAAANQQVNILNYLRDKFPTLVLEKDKWGRSPSAYIKYLNNYDLQSKLKDWERQMEMPKH